VWQRETDLQLLGKLHHGVKINKFILRELSSCPSNIAANSLRLLIGDIDSALCGCPLEADLASHILFKCIDYSRERSCLVSTLNSLNIPHSVVDIINSNQVQVIKDLACFVADIGLQDW
jgi:hypothetical protein